MCSFCSLPFSQCANARALFEDLNKWNTMTKMIVPENNNDIIWGGCHDVNKYNNTKTK